MSGAGRKDLLLITLIQLLQILISTQSLVLYKTENDQYGIFTYYLYFHIWNSKNPSLKKIQESDHPSLDTYARQTTLELLLDSVSHGDAISHYESALLPFPGSCEIFRGRFMFALKKKRKTPLFLYTFWLLVKGTAFYISFQFLFPYCCSYSLLGFTKASVSPLFCSRGSILYWNSS